MSTETKTFLLSFAGALAALFAFAAVANYAQMKKAQPNAGAPVAIGAVTSSMAANGFFA